MKSRPRIDWRFAALATLVVTCLFTLQSLGGEGSAPFAVAHRHQLVSWAIWLGLTPAIIWAGRRQPFGATSPTRWLLRQLMIGAAFAVVAFLLGLGFRVVMGTPPASPSAVSVVAGFAAELLRYAIIAGIYHIVSAYRAAREREALAARLRAELAEARLAHLEGRLHPHFLFNTLNSIAVLVREDPVAAEAMVEQLSDLLQASLSSDPSREVSLDEELRLVEQYLAIQRVRFQDRLRTSVQASDAARRGRVPQLILQPLVENAVRHGIAPRESGGSLVVSASVDRQSLVMTVEDDGVGIGNAPAGLAGSGLGLTSVESRLAHLYGAEQRFEVTDRQPTGTRITIALPYRPAAA